MRGNIKSDFTVEADGDIEVHGVVEGAVLRSNSNIFLNRGVQGNNQAELNCKDSLIAKYIENTKILAGGNIEADCILHSIVSAKKKIIIKGKRGLVVGGIVKAGEEIDAKLIGSSMGILTKIEVGIDPETKDKQINIQESIETMTIEIENATKGKIHVSSTIHPGVKITIYNTTKHIYDDVAMSTLYYKEGDIVIGLYEK